MKILATICLDGGEFDGQRGKLAWSNGVIMCILPDGSVEDTHVGCSREGAADVIRDAWGRNWDLDWQDEIDAIC